MILLLTSFLFQQNPTYAIGTWTKYGATLENTHLQYMKGAMMSAPDVKWSFRTGAEIESFGAAVADVDNDDTMEVVIGSCDYNIYCLNGVTGIMKWIYTTGYRVYSSSAAIADIDKDSIMEVVIGSDDYKVYCLNGTTGGLKWSYTSGGPIYSSPVIADIDKDSTEEVVFGCSDKKVYCLNGITGIVKWSYLTRRSIRYSAPAIADIDKDDTMEVVVGSLDSTVYCLNGITGAVKWSYMTGDGVESSPAIADINKDDTMEVVIGSHDSTVYCFNGVTGAVKWSYLTGGGIYSSPAIADMGGDGDIEITIGSGDKKIYCLNGITGGVKWSYNTNTHVHRAPSIADINMDGKFEVLVPNVLVPNNSGFPDTLFCLNGEYGTVLWKKEVTRDVHDITIADIDNDGCVELVVGTVGDSTIWAFDDITNSTNCGCMKVEEKLNIKNQNAKLKIVKEKIYLSVPNTMEVDIKLYDVCGRLKQIFYIGILSKGNYIFDSSIKKIGIYFVVLRTGNITRTAKIIKLK
ncbi:MAG: PQQ-binding-like beta-propeller repeat protein [bacterium]|nr:PQQ-binding-like beta-propeller repeat protein [bacterium]